MSMSFFMIYMIFLYLLLLFLKPYAILTSKVINMIRQYTKQYEIPNDKAVVVKNHVKGRSRTHWHDYFEMEYIVDGVGEYMVDGTIYTVKPGMMFFMTPINFHGFEDVDADMIKIMFTENLASPEALSSISEHGIEHGLELSPADVVFVENLLEEIDSALAEKDITYASALLNTLLLKLGKTATKSISASLSYVRNAMLYIRNNFRSRISLEDVAKAVDISPAYLSSIFPKETNIGYKEYLNTLRFEYAKKLLMYSDMSIGEICFESDFDDYANFMRSFKKRFDTSPALYRKELSKK